MKTVNKKLSALVALNLIIMGCTQKQNETDCALSVNDASGKWDVALYFNPPNPPSKTEMVVALDDDGKLSGSFYGSTFETAKGVLFENEYALTAVTSDGTGPYIHSGRLKCDGKFYGQTLSTGRDFIMPWIATREGAK